VESSIKDTHLRHSRENCAHSLDSKNIRRIVKRCEDRTLLELGDDLICDELAAHKLLCSMNHTMSYGLNILEGVENTIFLVKKSVDHSLDTYGMVTDRHFLHELFLSGRLMLEAADLHSDSPDKTLGEQIIHLVILHIQKLILQ
jgi:hypothetical protein